MNAITDFLPDAGNFDTSMKVVKRYDGHLASVAEHAELLLNVARANPTRENEVNAAWFIVRQVIRPLARGAPFDLPAGLLSVAESWS